MSLIEALCFRMEMPVWLVALVFGYMFVDIFMELRK
jgi:hypothetical protein